MEILLWTLLALQTTAILVPVQTGSLRCLAIYSSQQQDTIKVTMQFPQDTALESHYDYIAIIRDLTGKVLQQRVVPSRLFRTEVSIPNNTIYEACMGILPNTTKIPQTGRYHGEVLVDYEANSYFIVDPTRSPQNSSAIREEEVSLLRGQAMELMNVTKQFLEMQRWQREEETREYEEKRQEEDSLLEWWMCELLVILGLGWLQWGRMKQKLAQEVR